MLCYLLNYYYKKCEKHISSTAVLIIIEDKCKMSDYFLEKISSSEMKHLAGLKRLN